MRYASETTVSSDKSRTEIERTLTRYGADQFMYGWELDGAMVGFRMNGRMVRFLLPLPQLDSFRRTPTGQTRTESAAEKEYWQATRQRWRALALVVKAKLEAVESGITTFDDEFLAHIMLPDGSTVSEYLGGQVALAYENGKMPRLALPAPKKETE